MAQWPDNLPMLVLSGESGQGKSWLLYALANRLATEKELAILVEATGDANQDLAQAASLFWRVIKCNDTGPGLDRIAARRRELIHGRAERWLTVFVDGVQDPAEVKGLALAPWEDWNVRLVVTCQSDFAGMFKRQGKDRAVIFEVGDFTVPQLQLYLEERFGDQWPSIPADIRNTIRRPLLAQLYSTVAGNRSWRPANEYELCSAYWNRLREDEQAVNPLDVVGLQRLARSLLNEARYPWGPEQLAEAGLENSAVARLIRSGYLRQTEAGQYEFWHDRILNWAVAQGLVAALYTKEMDAEAFCTQLQSLFIGNRTYSGKFLGYVPMDAVWAVAAPECGLSSLTDQVIQALEGAGWQHADVLYNHLLPTVGPRIIPTLYRRLIAVSSTGDVVLENRIVAAIVTFAETDTADRTAELLKTGAPLAKRAALKILAKQPNPKLLDAIWKLRCQTQTDFGHFLREGDWKELLDEECYQALKAAIRLDRRWLERAIVQADPIQEPVHDLAYLVASLDDADDIWRAHKSALFAKVQPPNHRSLALNIYVYRDADEIKWLIGQLGRSENLIGATAFRALIRINPDLALEHLAGLPEQQLYFTRQWCFGELLARRPEGTLSCIYQMMMGHPQPRNLGQVFQGQENAFDERSLDILLGDLESVLDDELAGQRLPNRAELWGLCGLLTKANCLHHLRQFWKRQGTALEEKLTAWLLKRGWFSGGFVDTEARVALDVLYKVGGVGFTQVVNAYLDSDDRFGCLEGAQLAVKRPDDVTIQKLVRVSLRDGLWEDRHALLQGYAAKALATLDRHKEVVNSILKWGLRMLSVVTDHHLGNAQTDPAVVKTCLDALSAGTDAPAGALIALGIYGATEHAELVRGILAKAAPNSDTAKACVISLGQLKDQSREAVDLIRQQMMVLDHPHIALRTLSRIGTDEARTVGLDSLESQYQVELAADLLVSPVTREKAVELTRRFLSSAEPFHWGQTVEKLVQYVDDDQLLTSLVEESRLIEYLHEVAFAEEGGIWFGGSKARAIKGLAQFDSGAAFLAALKALSNPSSHDREYYPYILVEINVAKAIPALLGLVAEEKSTAVTWAIGRALADIADFSIIQSWLSDSDPHKRLAACRTCERLRPATQILQALQSCLDDVDISVAGAAREAIQRLLLALEAERLIEAFLVEQNASKRWVLLDSLLAIADPGDKHRPLPGWARRLMDALPHFMRVYFAEKLQKQREEAVKEAEKRDK